MQKRKLAIIGIVMLFLISVIAIFVSQENSLTGNFLNIFSISKQKQTAKATASAIINYVEPYDLSRLPTSVTKAELYRFELIPLGFPLKGIGNLAPFPTKSKMPSSILNSYGIIGRGPADLRGFYLLEGPFTKRTPRIVAVSEDIADGAKTEDTVLNIWDWMRSNIDCPYEERARLIETLESGDQRRNRTAEQIIDSRCAVGCRDFATVFAAIAREKGISVAITETLDDEWVLNSALRNEVDLSISGHFFTDIYLPEQNRWIVFDSTAGVFTDRTREGYYPVYARRSDGGFDTIRPLRQYVLFERGLDNADFGVVSKVTFRDEINKKYYIAPRPPPPTIVP